MSSFTVQGERTQFLMGEDILLSLMISNSSGATIVIPDPTKAASPQPVYALLGPR